jgi:hypothetical protein
MTVACDRSTDAIGRITDEPIALRALRFNNLPNNQVSTALNLQSSTALDLQLSRVERSRNPDDWYFIFL